MTAVEENVSVYQVYPVSRITGEGRAELLRALGARWLKSAHRQWSGTHVFERTLSEIER